MCVFVYAYVCASARLFRIVLTGWCDCAFILQNDLKFGVRCIVVPLFFFVVVDLITYNEIGDRKRKGEKKDKAQQTQQSKEKLFFFKSQENEQKKTQHILCAMYCLSGALNMHCIALFSLFVLFPGISFSFTVRVLLVFNNAGNSSNRNICTKK